MAFGGVGTSGYGRYGGFEGFKQLSNRKGILKKGPTYKAILNYAMPPFTDSKMKNLRMLANMKISYGTLLKSIVCLLGIVIAAVIIKLAI